MIQINFIIAAELFSAIQYTYFQRNLFDLRILF